MFRFRREVYLDNNATTKVTKKVRKKVNQVLKYYYGNPSSLYRVARNAAIVLEESHTAVARAINAEPYEIYFTGSATEANNAIIKTASEVFYPNKKKILTTPIEHQSVVGTLEYLENKGINVAYLPIDSKGRIRIDKIEALIDDNTFLVCCMLANNETGTIQDIQKIVEIAKKHNVLVMSDCVQALGKIKVDVKELGIDYASFSAHKIHGPKGVGAMFIKEGSPLLPFIHGGHQESGMRAGTESLHNIAGFSQACKDIGNSELKADKIVALKEKFISELKSIKQDIIINSPSESCLPNTINITFPGVNNAVFMAVLDFYGIGVSAGSSCNTQDNEPSHVLMAIGLSETQARHTIRFGLSDETSFKDIQYVIRIIRDFLEDKLPPIDLLSPQQLDENLLFDEHTFILDVRFWYDRKFLKGLPNSHEVSFLFFKKYLQYVPRDKNIIVVCQGGFNSPIVAYYLRTKGFKHVSILLTGLIGWRICHPELYNKFCGKNIKELEPRSFL